MSCRILFVLSNSKSREDISKTDTMLREAMRFSLANDIAMFWSYKYIDERSVLSIDLADSFVFCSCEELLLPDNCMYGNAYPIKNYAERMLIICEFVKLLMSHCISDVIMYMSDQYFKNAELALVFQVKKVEVRNMFEAITGAYQEEGNTPTIALSFY